MKSFIFKFANILASSVLIPVKYRVHLLRIAGIKVEKSDIRAKCFFSSKNISIGKHSFINSHCKFFATNKGEGHIRIGEHTSIAMNVLITTMTHEIGSEKHRNGNNLYLPVNIGNGCWVGTNATILPGVTIGDGCIIAAGAVVNRDCKPNGLYAGVPAKRIKDLPVESEKKAIS